MLQTLASQQRCSKATQHLDAGLATTRDVRMSRGLASSSSTTANILPQKTACLYPPPSLRPSGDLPGVSNPSLGLRRSGGDGLCMLLRVRLPGNVQRPRPSQHCLPCQRVPRCKSTLLRSAMIWPTITSMSVSPAKLSPYTLQDSAWSQFSTAP